MLNLPLRRVFLEDRQVCNGISYLTRGRKLFNFRLLQKGIFLNNDAASNSSLAVGWISFLQTAK